MPIKTDDKLVKDLNQIKQKQEDVLNRIDEIKQNADEELLGELAKIEQNAWLTVIEIDELKKKINLELTNLIERNTILYRMPKGTNKKPEKIGNVWI